MTAPITFTLDLEDHRPDDAAPLRYPAATRTILEFLERRGIIGTFFVVGTVAESEPDLVRDIAAAGHEIGLHGWEHIPLVDLDRESLRVAVTKGKALLEDLAGAPVVGYRAPTFSLVSSTTWATEVLSEAGFAYSSSVLPTANPLYGFPGAPEDPFVWPSGLVEFPVPIAGVGRVRVPYLGGTYLRLIPRPLIASAHRRGARAVPWTYLHPYDIDTAEKYWKVPDTGWMSPLLWVGRKRVLRKLDGLLAQPAGSGGNALGAGPPLRDRLDDARRRGTYDPAATSPAGRSASTPEAS